MSVAALRSSACTCGDTPRAGWPRRHLMVNLYTSYSIVQAVAIVMLIGRLVGAWDFPARVGRLCPTLWRAAEPLMQLGLMVLVISLLLAATNHIMLGWRQERVASMADAVRVRWATATDSWPSHLDTCGQACEPLFSIGYMLCCVG
jgi:hypothetical protein